MARSIPLMALLICSGLLAVACQQTSHDRHSNSMLMAQNAGKVAIAEMKPAKAATTQPTNNNVHGTVTFTEEAGGKVKVTAHIMGLTPNTVHGFHIHEKGDMSAPDLTSTGGHYNPDGHQHAAPNAPMRHAGDLGNITADANGMAMLDITVEGISLGGEKNDVLGKAVIVHGGADDLKTQPTGAAGSRVAGGVIEMKK